MNELWLYTISHLYPVKYKINNSFHFLVFDRQGKETIDIKSCIKGYL